MRAIDFVLKRNIPHEVFRDGNGEICSVPLLPPLKMEPTTATFAAVIARPGSNPFEPCSADVLTTLNVVSPGKGATTKQSLLLQEGTLELDREAGRLSFDRNRVIDLLVPTKQTRHMIRTHRTEQHIQVAVPRDGILHAHQTEDGVYYLLLETDDALDILFAFSSSDINSFRVFLEWFPVYPGCSRMLGRVVKGQPAIDVVGGEGKDAVTYAAGLFTGDNAEVEELPAKGVELERCGDVGHVVLQLIDAAHQCRKHYPSKFSGVSDLWELPEGWYHDELGGYILPVIYQGESFDDLKLSGFFKPLVDQLVRS